MTGSIAGASGGNVSSYGLLGQLVANSATVRDQLNTLTLQSGSGLVSTSYAGLGVGARTSLILQPAIAHQTAWSNGISAASSQMSVAQTALSQISSIASSFYSQAADLNGLNPSNVDTIAASARSALAQVASLLDSKDGDIYVFAGQDSTNPPVPSPDAINASGFATQIAAAIGNLSTAGASATIAGTLTIASSNDPTISPFSVALTQSAADPRALRTSVQTGDGAQTPTGILANANADVTSTGDATTGSYMRDIMRSLATLGSLSSSQLGDAGFQDVVSDAQAGLGGAISMLNSDSGVMGNRQAQLKTAQTTLSDMSTVLQGQLSDVQDVDMATTLSKLSQVQTQLQASYQMIAAADGLSLTKYLSGGG